MIAFITTAIASTASAVAATIATPIAAATAAIAALRAGFVRRLSARRRYDRGIIVRERRLYHIVAWRNDL